MPCVKCGSNRIADVSAKCSDMCSVAIDGKECSGYVPSDIGIGSGDYIDLTYCLACGQIAGEWPRPITDLENGDEDGEDDDD